MSDPLIFACSLIFLSGILMVALTVFPQVRERYPQIMLHGFLVTVSSFVLVLLIGVLR